MTVGVFAGSFNPFHVGHLNVLQQAERHFDKVIIAIGKNADKPASEFVAPNLPNQIDFYDGLLVDYLKKLPYHVSLIRGLRNGNDLQYELNMRATLKDLAPDVDVVYFLCDGEFSHVSSSMVRDLQRFNRGTEYIV